VSPLALIRPLDPVAPVASLSSPEPDRTRARTPAIRAAATAKIRITVRGTPQPYDAGQARCPRARTCGGTGDTRLNEPESADDRGLHLGVLLLGDPAALAQLIQLVELVDGSGAGRLLHIAVELLFGLD